MIHDLLDPSRLVIHSGPRPQPREEDISGINRIYWIDNQPRSVQSLFTALGMPPPEQFVAFFPKSLEDKLKEDAKNRQMAELYRQHVLKEAPKAPVIQIQGLKRATAETRN